VGDVAVGGSLEGVDWKEAKADLAADRFDNGRSADALRLSEFWSLVVGSWLGNDANRGAT
jgi:hypothetical protein